MQHGVTSFRFTVSRTLAWCARNYVPLVSGQCLCVRIRTRKRWRHAALISYQDWWCLLLTDPHHSTTLLKHTRSAVLRTAVPGTYSGVEYNFSDFDSFLTNDLRSSFVRRMRIPQERASLTQNHIQQNYDRRSDPNIETVYYSEIYRNTCRLIH